IDCDVRPGSVDHIRYIGTIHHFSRCQCRYNWLSNGLFFVCSRFEVLTVVNTSLPPRNFVIAGSGDRYYPCIVFLPFTSTLREHLLRVTKLVSLPIDSIFGSNVLWHPLHLDWPSLIISLLFKI